jgi:hypothetical protein
MRTNLLNLDKKLVKQYKRDKEDIALVGSLGPFKDRKQESIYYLKNPETYF